MTTDLMFLAGAGGAVALLAVAAVIRLGVPARLRARRLQPDFVAGVNRAAARRRPRVTIRDGGNVVYRGDGAPGTRVEQIVADALRTRRPTAGTTTSGKTNMFAGSADPEAADLCILMDPTSSAASRTAASRRMATRAQQAARRLHQ